MSSFRSLCQYPSDQSSYPPLLSPCHTNWFQTDTKTAPCCLNHPEKLCQDTLRAELTTACTWDELSKLTALVRTPLLLSQQLLLQSGHQVGHQSSLSSWRTKALPSPFDTDPQPAAHTTWQLKDLIWCHLFAQSPNYLALLRTSCLHYHSLCYGQGQILHSVPRWNSSQLAQLYIS